MVRYAFLIIATVLTVLFLILLIIGRKYDAVVEKLVGSEYTLSEVYGVGFMWAELIPALGYSGNLGNYVSKDIALLVDHKYREFYTRAVLAKAYTFVHLGTCASLLLGLALFQDATAYLIAFAGVVVSIIMGRNVLQEPAKEVQRISDEVVIELPNMVTKLALLINSGMILRSAWFYVADHTTGEIAERMKLSCEQMRNGHTEVDAIYNFGNSTNSKEMKKLASMVIQGIEKGPEELSALLLQLSTELWLTKRQRMLQMGELAAAKLMIPTMLMFVGLILVVVVSSLGGLSI